MFLSVSEKEKASKTGVTNNKHKPSFVINGEEIKEITETTQNP